MTRIKEILKEKGITVQELADMLEISRQALSKQIQGKMLVETAQRIASKLDVPLWQLFASPKDVKWSIRCYFVPTLRKAHHHQSRIRLKVTFACYPENHLTLMAFA